MSAPGTFQTYGPCPHGVRYAPHNRLSQPAKLMTMGLILPDGQISWCFAKAPVQPLLQKYFCSRLTQISSLIRTVPSRQEGRIARRHERGAGCGGRESVRRCQGMAGRVDTARELTNGTRTNDVLADGKAVWFWHPLLVLNSRRLVGPTGL